MSEARNGAEASAQQTEVKCWRCERVMWVNGGPVTGLQYKKCERCKAKNKVVNGVSEDGGS